MSFKEQIEQEVSQECDKNNGIDALRDYTPGRPFVTSELSCNCTKELTDEIIEMTIFEYLLCKKLINKGYSYIARDADRELFVYNVIPVKRQEKWISKNHYIMSLYLFNDIFQFVQEQNDKYKYLSMSLMESGNIMMHSYEQDEEIKIGKVDYCGK